MLFDRAAGELFLESKSTSPDAHRDGEENTPHDFTAGGTREPLQVLKCAEDVSADHLHKPVEQTVERARPDVEVGGVDTVELIPVEPVTGQKHREQQNDIRVTDQSLVETLQLRPPGGILHHNDARPILAFDVLGVRKAPGENEADGHEDHESDVSAITDGSGARVYVLTEGDLQGD